tara:strand:- start:872 stop:2092 length:1221 start_codon:yes stop_codon:yes gene_type:complete
MASVLYGQVLDLQPELGTNLDFSPEAVAKFNSPEAFEECSMVYKKMNADGRNWEELTKEEKNILKYCDETKESIWATEGGGCSWYCGMGPKNIEASSSLASQGVNTYSPTNAHDFSYKTAWVEGVKGYGIGEYLLYKFAAENPRINTIKVVNGYVKSQSAWNNNSRVKKLNMYVNNELFAYLNLKDVKAEQHFSIPAIGNGDRANYDALKKKGDWTVKFEIAEVYEGAKYDDVVISEIFFDGLDVHCFAAGTRVLLANGTESNIEDLTNGQEVMSMNNSTGKLEPSEIIELASPTHSNLVELTFTDGRTVVATEDHPFYDGQRWLSLNPNKTQADYTFGEVSQLAIGIKLQTIEGDIELASVKRIPKPQRTYTIVKLSRNRTFIANGIVVGTEELRIIIHSPSYTE